MTEKHPTYPGYRATGVEWLGEIPDCWQLFEGKRLFANRREPGRPEDEQLAASQQYGIVPQTLMMRLNGAKVMLALNGVSAFRRVEAGDFVISLRSFQGGIEHSAYSGCVSPAYTVLEPLRRIAAAYCRYLFKSGPFIAALQSTTDSLRDGKAISFTQFAEIPLPVPTLEEQAQIAKFLDYETAKIDALIEKQQQLIALLKEKRQAVISHAVTKGLNPDAPMRDSGVEWLSKVPAHWQVVKMKWVAKMESGHTPDKKVPAYWDDGDIPWVSLNDTGYLKDHDYISETAYAVTQLGIENSSAHLLPPKAVVFSRDATIGRCAITMRPMAVSQHFIAWICSERLVPEFLLLRLRSMTGELERLTTGATVKTIGMPEVRTLVTPVPPVAEQQAVVGWVGREMAQIDSLIAEATRAIDLLQERRTALISAAVTGKIDVRSWTPPTPEVP